MSKYLLADIGSTYTKVCVLSTDSSEVVAHAVSPTTIETDVCLGFNAVCKKIEKFCGNIKEKLVCSSAAGGLKMAVVGLIPEITMEAGRQAALGAGAKVIKSYSFVLTGDDILELKTLEPDIILLTGGVDGGDTGYILKNAKKIKDNLKDVPLIVAGNRSAKDDLKNIFEKRKNVYFSENVMPEFKKLNLNPVRELIRKVFLERITEAKGLSGIEKQAKILLPTPNAVFNASALLASGIKGKEEGLGELMVVDMGGATTDVYSFAEGTPKSERVIMKGFPEPFDKRTVEADIGMRHTLRYLYEQADLKEFIGKSKISVEKIQSWVEKAGKDASCAAESKDEVAIETALAAAGCEIAVNRHCGKYEEAFTPEGKVLIQEGKDLTEVKTVIGSGGPLVNSKNPKEMLFGVKRKPGEIFLKPKNPEYFLDSKYIMWAVGLLSEVEPLAALKIMKMNLRRL
ncbi:MAG: hypothetical protein A2231_06535 [Candidatus Firestonebacteria bacterium RIFOXYA2_FULL_40_8]|nr:MAG: hypothetical protein A2231_06535 [Candidatus Firestonebacteria bacterium RIFOXYA2_FULL_40_8]